MEGIRHRFIALISALLLITLIPGCFGVPAGSAQKEIIRSIPLHDCQLSIPGQAARQEALCGTLQVYENRAAATGRQIGLNIAVIPAVSRTPLTDPLFLIAGGPGQSAAEAFLPFISIFDSVRQTRDLVLVDQRGTGGSNSLQCPSTGNEPGILDASISDSQRRSLVEACLKQLPGDPRYYTTSLAVEDLEQVRQALGYDQINLLGVSYGTRVALEYMRLYPQNARTAILDGVTPMDWSIGPDIPQAAQRALDLDFARCTTDTACAAAFPNLQSEFKSILTDLGNQPAEVTVADPTTGEPTRVTLTQELVAATIHTLTYTEEEVSLIPLLIHTTYTSGDYQLLGAQYLFVNSALGETISVGMYFSVVCAEDVPFYPDEASILAAEAKSYLPDTTAVLRKVCALWPHAAVPASFKQAVQSDVPVLLLSGEDDPITPPSNAAQAARTLPNNLQIVAPGMGHNVVYRGCLPAVATAFIDEGRANNLNISCVNNIQPLSFFLNFSGPKP